MSLFILFHLRDYSGNIFGVMHMYLNLMLEMEIFTLGFIVVKSDVGVMTSPG